MTAEKVRETERFEDESLYGEPASMIKVGDKFRYEACVSDEARLITHGQQGGPPTCVRTNA